MKRINNHKGYTMVELLVVLAIMAVGLGIFSISIATIFSNNVRSAASDIDSVLSKGRVSSNYRRQWVMVEIDYDGSDLVVRYYEGAETDGSGGIAAGWSRQESEVIGTDRIPVSLEGFTATSLPVIIAFERGTGRMQEVVAGNSEPQDFAGSDAAIILGNAGGTRYTVALSPYVGGHEVRR